MTSSFLVSFAGYYPDLAGALPPEPPEKNLVKSYPFNAFANNLDECASDFTPAAVTISVNAFSLISFLPSLNNKAAYE